jgi:hypothetical protein
MATNRFTIVYEAEAQRFKLCKIILNGDGTYFITVPYHVSDKVYLSKQTVNFLDPNNIHRDPPIEYSLIDDDEHRLKLSHHPDGFVQFSGHNIVSGRNADGSPKGIGLQSWPLNRPTAGPACAICIQNPLAFKKAETQTSADIIFKAEDLYSTAADNGLVIETYYFPGTWRRFVRVSNVGPVIWFKHPSGAIVEARVCKSPPDDWNTGFIGLDLWPAPINLGETSGFTISSPTGGLRYNTDNQLEGEGLYAWYPPIKDEIKARFVNLAFAPRNDPPYTKGGRPPSAD